MVQGDLVMLLLVIVLKLLGFMQILCRDSVLQLYWEHCLCAVNDHCVDYCFSSMVRCSNSESTATPQSEVYWPACSIFLMSVSELFLHENVPVVLLTLGTLNVNIFTSLVDLHV